MKFIRMQFITVETVELNKVLLSGCQGAGSRRCLSVEEEKSPPGEDPPAGGGAFHAAQSKSVTLQQGGI